MGRRGMIERVGESRRRTPADEVTGWMFFVSGGCFDSCLRYEVLGSAGAQGRLDSQGIKRGRNQGDGYFQGGPKD